MLHVWDLLQKQHGPISSQNPLKGEYDDSDVFIQHFDLTSCPVKGTKAKMFIQTKTQANAKIRRNKILLKKCAQCYTRIRKIEFLLRKKLLLLGVLRFCGVFFNCFLK